LQFPSLPGEGLLHGCPSEFTCFLFPVLPLLPPADSISGPPTVHSESLSCPSQPSRHLHIFTCYTPSLLLRLKALQRGPLPEGFAKFLVSGSGRVFGLLVCRFQWGLAQVKRGPCCRRSFSTFSFPCWTLPSPCSALTRLPWSGIFIRGVIAFYPLAVAFAAIVSLSVLFTPSHLTAVEISPFGESPPPTLITFLDRRPSDFPFLLYFFRNLENFFDPSVFSSFSLWNFLSFSPPVCCRPGPAQ